MTRLSGDCPKRMRYGPCGGVRPDLSCELGTGPCPFAGRPVERWDGPPVRSVLPPALTGPGPMVLTDLTSSPYDAGALARHTRILAGACDALLIGQHHDAPDFPPTLLAALVREAGGRAWVTLTCRDRNRVVLEQDVAGLVAAGADAVLCVTGDGRAPGVRPDVTQVFDLDGTRLAAIAAGAGLAAVVPEAPAAPPVDLRPARLAEKQRAGAGAAVLNHAGSPSQVARFVERARRHGATLPVLAGVAVFTDEPGARVLQAFPGLELDPGTVRAVLCAPDPVEAGIEAAVDEAVALLAVDGVAGVNLSGRGSSGDHTAGTEIKAEIGRRIRARVRG